MSLDSLARSCKNLIPIGILGGMIYGVLSFIGFKIETTIVTIFLIFVFLLVRSQGNDIEEIKSRCKKMHGYINLQTAILIVLILLIVWLIITGFRSIG